MATPSRLSITWLGHATFLLITPGGKRVLLDPWLVNNPACPAEWKKPEKLGRLDLILVTHGHFDHVDDAVAVARATNAPLVAIYDLCAWLEQKGMKNTTGMNKGGTIEIAGLRVTMVTAEHSSSYMEDGRLMYLGDPVGYVIQLENGQTIYFSGDTALFGDMRLIKEMYAPEIAFLPIGDHFTMGPDGAARACELLGVRQVVPMHWGTFPLLTGTPARLKALVEPLGIDVLELKPGETAK